MSDEKLCKSCRYWSPETDNDYPETFEFRKCDRVKMFWQNTEWDDAGEKRILSQSSKGNLAFVQDGSDYKAELITLPEFGCVQHEFIMRELRAD